MKKCTSKCGEKEILFLGTFIRDCYCGFYCANANTPTERKKELGQTSFAHRSERAGVLNLCSGLCWADGWADGQMTHNGVAGWVGGGSTEVNSIPCFSTFPELRSLESSGPGCPRKPELQEFRESLDLRGPTSLAARDRGRAGRSYWSTWRHRWKESKGAIIMAGSIILFFWGAKQQ